MPDIKIYGNIDETCSAQINAIADLQPFSQSKIRIMPDAHSGKNSVVGFTSTIEDKIIPNIVGGDIGCGVLAVQLKRPKKGMDFTKLDKVIRSAVPNGVGSINDKPILDFDFSELHCWESLPSKHLIPRALGSLGAGNHFIAIDQDSSKNFWLVVHSGSRNLGTQVAEYYQSLAAKNFSDSEVPHSMAWLEGEEKKAYLHDMDIACRFASENRKTIVQMIIKEYGFKTTGNIIESVHNYIDVENMIIRKGAIAAYEGENVIIPLNMAEGCVIGVGLGNDDWNSSAPHGSGRLMTRKDARNSISMSEYKKSMKDTWSSCVVPDTVDESPQAYKPSIDIISSISDTVEITDVMKEIYNYKAPTKENMSC